jgi:hypothetical protein
MSRSPHCLDSRLTDGGKAVSLTHQPRLNPINIFWYSFLLSREMLFLGSRVRPMREADNLTTICEPIV